MLWIVFGIGAIVFAIINVFRAINNKDVKWFRFISLALTALTICSFYSDGVAMVNRQDWAGLMDVMPTAGIGLWICTIASILINSISLFKEKKQCV